jgi:hypothetical protein
VEQSTAAETLDIGMCPSNAGATIFFFGYFKIFKLPLPKNFPACLIPPKKT